MENIITDSYNMWHYAKKSWGDIADTVTAMPCISSTHFNSPVAMVQVSSKLIASPESLCLKAFQHFGLGTYFNNHCRLKVETGKLAHQHWKKPSTIVRCMPYGFSQSVPSGIESLFPTVVKCYWHTFILISSSHFPYSLICAS